ncbi:hypothetical protein Lal_00016824 [Lupinus albus]|nr:hypothetical protein Lal_00016824 [Lupinus albus]
MMLKSTRLLSLAKPVGPTFFDHPAKMLTPGAIRSGFKICGVIEFGPLELKAATTGEGSENRYFLIASPSFSPTAVAGKRCASATNSSPFAGVFANTIPKPPADFTTTPF